MDRESERLNWESGLWNCLQAKGLTPFIFRPTHSPNARAQTLGRVKAPNTQAINNIKTNKSARATLRTMVALAARPPLEPELLQRSSDDTLKESPKLFQLASVDPQKQRNNDKDHDRTTRNRNDARRVNLSPDHRGATAKIELQAKGGVQCRD
jgi:hypothetical protein